MPLMVNEKKLQIVKTIYEKKIRTKTYLLKRYETFV